MIDKTLQRKQIDPTVEAFVVSLLKNILKALVFVAAIGMLGVQTSSFVAMFAAVGLAIISWRTASIAGDAINSYGQLFAYIHSGFAVMTLYQIMQGFAPNPQPFYINLVISVVLAAAFFYYSRKTE